MSAKYLVDTSAWNRSNASHEVSSRLTDLVASEEVALCPLASRSQHRGPTAVDLYVAAIAELNKLIVIHYDRHFDAIARVTRQPSEWIAPRGTLD